MEHSYWRTQTSTKPLFPYVEWNKPERRDQAGTLGIVGGSSLGFRGVATSYQAALVAGVGQARVLLPDGLRKTIPPTITDAVFAPSNPSGGFSAESHAELAALDAWSHLILLAGDNGQNSETAVLYERFLKDSDRPVVIARDALDLLLPSASTMTERPHTTLIASFAQTQKLFRTLYYPKMLTFSMQLSVVVETLHKFTLTYPVCLITLHAEHLLIAHEGQVVTQAFDVPMRLWSGELPGRIASYTLWSPDAPLDAAAAAIV